jgi:hypothetical protein
VSVLTIIAIHSLTWAEGYSECERASISVCLCIRSTRQKLEYLRRQQPPIHNPMEEWNNPYKDPTQSDIVQGHLN